MDGSDDGADGGGTPLARRAGVEEAPCSPGSDMITSARQSAGKLVRQVRGLLGALTHFYYLLKLSVSNHFAR